MHQHDQKLDDLKKSRRPGRPASVKEDLLSLKVETLRKEQQNGFCRSQHSLVSIPHGILLTDTAQVLPDLSKQNNIDLLNRWEGAWSFLAAMSYVRITEAGTIKSSSFPPSSQ